MPKPITKEFRELLQATPMVNRKIEVRYDPIFCKTIATITYTTSEDAFSLDVDICFGPIEGISDLWIGGVLIPAEDIVFHDPKAK
jgi:hypothetical protein